MPIRIDALPAAVSASADHEIPAMKDDETVKLTVDQIIGPITGSPPSDMNSLEKISASLGDDPDYAGTIAAALADKADADDVDINALTAKTPPVDADVFRIADSAASFGFKKLSFANLWAWISGKILTLFNASGSAPVYACRAWVNFNGTGTVAIRASGNVSSITDNGTGDYTINFTTAMPDANYAWSLGSSVPNAAIVAARVDLAAPTANSLRISSYNASFIPTDSANVTVAISR